MDFVATAAKAAKAGMAELWVATDALATVLQGYKLDASEATRVSDLMFQTVNVGKGTFQEFSRAFATVAPIASTMGINLEELSATLGTSPLPSRLPQKARRGCARCLQPDPEWREVCGDRYQRPESD